MAEYEKKVREILMQNGCTLNAIMKQSGIEYHF